MEDEVASGDDVPQVQDPHRQGGAAVVRSPEFVDSPADIEISGEAVEGSPAMEDEQMHDIVDNLDDSVADSQVCTRYR